MFHNNIIPIYHIAIMIDFSNICQGPLDLNTCGKSAADIITDDESLQDIGIETTLSTVEYGQQVSTSTPETPIDFTESKSIITEVSKSSNSTSSTASTTSDSSSSSKSQPKTKKGKMTTTLPERYALSIANNPVKHLFTSLIVSVIVTSIVLTFGNVKLEAGTKGFLSRGTTIANRSTQALLLHREMASKSRTDPSAADDRPIDFYCSGKWYGSKEMLDPSSTWLNSIWKTKDTYNLQPPQVSALDATAMYEMCLAEENTLNFLQEHNLCYKCPTVDGGTETTKKCLQPYSLVAAARLYLNYLRGNFQAEVLEPSISCNELYSLWSENVQNQFTSLLIECTEYMLELAGIKPVASETSSMCSQVPILTSTIVDDQFLQTGIIKVTSSIYATKTDDITLESLYKADRNQSFVSTYNTEESLFEQGVYESGMNALHVPGKDNFGFVQVCLYASYIHVLFFI